MKKRYRIRSQKRFTIFLVLMLLLVTVVGSATGAGNHVTAMSEDAYTKILVQSGDTLWDLAKTYGPENTDLRKTIHTICTINEIEADEIHPGQTILIPNS